MHYANHREAHVGDPVIGTTYNRKGVQVGILVGITPGTDTCNCRVAIVESLPIPGFHYNRTGLVHVEPTDGSPVNALLSPVVDYSACANPYHAQDALAALADPSVPPTAT